MNNKVSEFREKIGVTQIEMASHLKITNDYLSMIERGARTPGFKLAKKIADYLNTTVDVLFFNVESNIAFDRKGNGEESATKEVS